MISMVLHKQNPILKQTQTKNKMLNKVMHLGAPFCTIKIWRESSRLIVVKISQGEPWLVARS